MKSDKLTPQNALEETEKFIAAIPPYPGGFAGRGIVICAGGPRYFTNAWVCVKMLRRLGCQLPIQFWHLGPREMSGEMKALAAPLGVECVDAAVVREKHPARILNGWEIKPYAILHSPFQEVLLLDADNVPVVDPELLFDTAQYRETGAIFWPDFGRLAPERSIWNLCGVAYRNEPEFETGQIVIDKERCWKAMCLTMWYNEHSDFFYQHIHGDKETFHLAFRKLNQPYSMPDKPLHALPHTMCQHDFEGNRVFQHRNLDKWRLSNDNTWIEGFLHEDECRQYLEELRAVWDGQSYPNRFNLVSQSSRVREVAKRILNGEFDYHRVGYDHRTMQLLENGTIGDGAGGCEVFWDLKEDENEIALEIHSHTELTCRLTEGPDRVWRGRWLKYEQMPVELVPCARPENRPRRGGVGGVFPDAAPSLFIVSLPRSLSTLLYHAICRATGFQEPVWTGDGEILNVDRFVLQGARNGECRKFIDKNLDPDLFYKTTEFLDQHVKAVGYAYKDVVQPFVVAEWIRRKNFKVLRIKRNVADVAFSMLDRQWNYPRRLFAETADPELALVRGLVRAEKALNEIPAEQIEFDDVIADEQAVRAALTSLYGDVVLQKPRYIDEPFQRASQKILNRRNNDKYRRLADLVSKATKGS